MFRVLSLTLLFGGLFSAWALTCEGPHCTPSNVQKAALSCDPAACNPADCPAECANKPCPTDCKTQTTTLTLEAACNPSCKPSQCNETAQASDKKAKAASLQPAPTTVKKADKT